MKIAWYGPGEPFASQAAELGRLFGGAQIDFRGAAGNAAATVADFCASGADELVVVAPLAVLGPVLTKGARPLWSEAEVVPAAQAEWSAGGKSWRFVRFRRLTKVGYRTEAAAALPGPKPARVAWLLRHACDAAQKSALAAIYGTEVVVVPACKGEFRGPRDVQDALALANATDGVLVAPMGLWDGLTKAGIHLLRGVMDGAAFVRFDRVIGIEQEFEELGHEPPCFFCRKPLLAWRIDVGDAAVCPSCEQECSRNHAGMAWTMTRTEDGRLLPDWFPAEVEDDD